MDSPIVIPEAQSLPPGSSLRRRVSMDSNSPEFEFWMVRNPSFPQPNLLSADELFVDGVLLPLHLRPAPTATHHVTGHPGPSPEPDPDDPEPPPTDPEPDPEPGPGPKITSSAVSSLSPSKRWRDIFKKDKDKEKDKKNGKSDREEKEKEKEKEKKKERKSGTGSTSSAELNINIWPFSRSRSAGNACTRPKQVFGAPTGSTRKVNSAPCSRSNSAGESKSRKWPSSPGRPGVHLGRSSPVWQVRRAGAGAAAKGLDPSARNADKAAAKKDPPDIRRSKASAAAPAKAKVLNLNVPMCIGYRNQLSCRSDDNSALVAGDGAGGNSRGGGGGGGTGGGGGGRGVGVGSVGSGNLFNFRSLFTKKVY